MDPNQINAIFNFLQNSQSSSNQNLQPFNNQNFQNIPLPFLNSPNNPNNQFSGFQYPYQFSNPNLLHGASMGAASGACFTDKEPETPRGSISESQFPPFSTQEEGLENVTLNEVEAGATEKKTRSRWRNEEDRNLIQSWLNVSKDPIVGGDQRGSSFWERVTQNYNNHRGSLKEKHVGQLKPRWQKLNAMVQKFAGCYKSADHLKKSGESENDILVKANEIYFKDTGEEFKHDYAWRLLKSEPKWGYETSDSSAKRAKLNASGAYSSSSNPETPTSEYNPASPTFIRPQGKKAAKRKGKGKVGETSSDDVVKAADAIEKIAIMREKELQVKDEFNRQFESFNKRMEEHKRMKEEEMWLNIIYKDTSGMNQRQLQDHEKICELYKKKLGLE